MVRDDLKRRGQPDAGVTHRNTDTLFTEVECDKDTFRYLRAGGLVVQVLGAVSQARIVQACPVSLDILEKSMPREAAAILKRFW